MLLPSAVMLQAQHKRLENQAPRHKPGKVKETETSLALCSFGQENCTPLIGFFKVDMEG